MGRTGASNKEVECRGFFGRRSEIGQEFWAELGKAHPRCGCEIVRVSSHSPGPVANEETLLTVVTNKGFVSIDGRVEPTLFDSRMSNGISTDRKAHTTKEDYDLRANKLVAAHPNKENLGSIELCVTSIRGIFHDNERAIAVYDTGLPENSSHAEIACTEVPPAETPGRKKVRAQLRKRVLDAALHDGLVMHSSALL